MGPRHGAQGTAAVRAVPWAHAMPHTTAEAHGAAHAVRCDVVWRRGSLVPAGTAHRLLMHVSVAVQGVPLSACELDASGWRAATMDYLREVRGMVGANGAGALERTLGHVGWLGADTRSCAARRAATRTMRRAHGAGILVDEQCGIYAAGGVVCAPAWCAARRAARARAGGRSGGAGRRRTAAEQCLGRGACARKADASARGPWCRFSRAWPRASPRWPAGQLLVF